MNELAHQLELYIPPARKRDALTSVKAGAVAAPRAGGQKAMLLKQYAAAPLGLTDDEAGIRTGLKARGACYWKRCSDLREAKLIEPAGFTRIASMQAEQMVCFITELGRQVIAEMEAE